MIPIFFYLPTCDNCKAIFKQLQGIGVTFNLRDIKRDPLQESEVELLKNHLGSFENLFSKRAQLYKSRNLANATLSEMDYKQLLLEHYTFLKRPVLLSKETAVAGNTAAAVQQMVSILESLK